MKFPDCISSVLILATVIARLVAAQTHKISSCFNSTYAIFEAQQRNPQPEYIVCPNTTIYVGLPSPDFTDFINGDWPLVALHPNTRILCGPDGSSSNHCVLTGAFAHVITLPDFPQLDLFGLSTKNLYISGFTFTGDASQAPGGLQAISVSLTAPGANQTLHDCRWRDIYYPELVRIAETEFTSEDALADRSIDVTLRDCEFRDGRYDTAVIVMSKQNLTIETTSFVNITHQPCVCNESKPTLIYCGTVGKSVANAEAFSDSYCTLRNNCIIDSSMEYAFLTASSLDGNTAYTTTDNNYVSSASTIQPEEGFCHHVTRRDGEDLGCDEISTASECQHKQHGETIEEGYKPSSDTSTGDSAVDDSSSDADSTFRLLFSAFWLCPAVLLMYSLVG